jgi:ABC-2 type transport system permease protein
MIDSSFNRILTMVERYVRIHMRNGIRLVELFFWPVMELLVWGFIVMFLQKEAVQGPAKLAVWLLTGMFFWDVLFRSQQAVGLAFMEELWSRNVLNLLISPLRAWEWVVSACLYGLIKTAVIAATLFLLAWALYAYNLSVLGFYLVPFLASLLLMGWALGLFTTGLLLRWGHSAEALVWAVPFLIQPFSAIFYPLSVYPDWLVPFCPALPSTHVLEGMREAAASGVFPWTRFAWSMGLNVLYMAAGAGFALRMLERGRESGRLVRMTA